MINKIYKIVQESPDKIAYKVNDNFITYKQLWDLATNYSKLLIKEGTSPIIIYGNKQVDVIISIISCILAKRTYIPITKQTPMSRLKEIINITKSSLILTNDSLKIDNINCCNLKDLNKFANEDDKYPNSKYIYIIFTSGSTGKPKGVPISKENLENFIEWISNLNPLSKYKNANVLNQANFSFDLSVADLYYSLCNGHTLIAYDTSDSNDLNKLYSLLKNESINIAIVTPTFIKLCLLDDSFNEKNYPDFKCIYFCGEKLEIKIVEKLWSRFPKLQIINAYGPTEATSAVSAILLNKNMLKDNLLPVGEVNNFATNIEISDSQIILKGKSVFNGYLGNITGGYYRENNINCYRTGDIGYIENNKLYCKGRIDNQIKYKGYRIELGDIENNINKISGVIESCVVAIYDDKKNIKTIKAFVVSTNKNITSDYIKEKLLNLVPEYMVPKTIKIIDSLPISQNNKVDRKALINL